MLYHSSIWLPPELKAQIKPVFGLKYSQHALNEARADRNGEIITLPKHFLPRLAQIIEVETDDGGTIIKVLARQYYDVVYDVVMAIIPQVKLCKTIWKNRRDDRHFTLDRTRYARRA